MSNNNAGKNHLEEIEQMANDIEHTGVVLEIVGNRVDVSIQAHSGCGSCTVKGVCGMSETKEKIVSIVVEYPQAYKIGQEVVVSVEKAMGMKAVTLAYIIPLFFLCASLITLLSLGVGEIVAGVSTIGVVGVYYAVLYLFRERIGREIVFKIKYT